MTHRYLSFLPFIIAITFTIHSFSFAQNDLYIPLNIKKAYENGTRSYDGSPGPNYWQNSAEYNIKVEVVTKTKMLFGSETIIYKNNSPDTLKTLVIRLYQDIFKIGNARDYSAPAEAINDGVEVSKIIVRGEEIDPDSSIVKRKDTNLILDLDDPLPPDSEIDLAFEWNFIIPHEYPIRMGAYDSTSFFIGYWYPQVSVYDDIDGWDMFNYGGQQEFYNDFSSFQVEIKVPNTFCVWATSVLQNPDEVLTEKILDRFNIANNSEEVIRIVTADDLLEGNIFNNTNSHNIWKFNADNVTDFTFAMSDHYLWDGTSVIVDSTTNRKTFVDAAYKESSKDFPDVTQIAKEYIQHCSFEMPAWPYPFPTTTIFNGRGGMEFPMMINDGSFPTLGRTLGVTTHEVAHMYFPFYMGINERKYAFMDEGWADMLPFDFQVRMVEDYDQRSFHILGYQNKAGTEIDIPLAVPSIQLRGAAYGIAAYTRPGAAYDLLRDMLGDTLFLKAMHSFINRWNGKHPIPYDFYYTFNEATGKNLNWYWKPWFFEFGYPDLSINTVAQDGAFINVTVKKEGNIPIPVKLTFYYDDETDSERYNDASVWEGGDEVITISEKREKVLRKIILGGPHIPDVNSYNNTYHFE
jgi:hypothetical protein